MPKRPTCYDVARIARVSRTLVSAVVNGTADRYRISRKTQDRIRTAISQLGYQPNRAIRNLFLNRKDDRDSDHAQAPDPLKIKAVIQAALAAAGYSLPVVALTGDPTTARPQARETIGLNLAVVIGAGPVISEGWPVNPIPINLPDDTQVAVFDKVEPQAPTPVRAPVPAPTPPTARPVPTPPAPPPVPQPPAAEPLPEAPPPVGGDDKAPPSDEGIRLDQSTNQLSSQPAGNDSLGAPMDPMRSPGA